MAHPIHCDVSAQPRCCVDNTSSNPITAVRKKSHYSQENSDRVTNSCFNLSSSFLLSAPACMYQGPADAHPPFVMDLKPFYLNYVEVLSSLFFRRGFAIGPIKRVKRRKRERESQFNSLKQRPFVLIWKLSQRTLTLWTIQRRERRRGVRIRDQGGGVDVVWEERRIRNEEIRGNGEC